MRSQDLSTRARRLIRPAFGLLITGVAAAWAHAVLGLSQDGPLADVLNVGVYNLVLVVSAALCLYRSRVVPEERLPWLLIGAALALWSVSEIVWAAVYAGNPDPPAPSLSDIGWLAWYPAIYVALMLMLRGRVKRLQRSLWLDGLTGGLALAALTTSLVWEPIVSGSKGSPAAVVATSLAYPVGDVLLVGFVVWMFGMMGWRPEPRWLMLGLGLAAAGLGDVLYLYQSATGSEAGAPFANAVFLSSALLIAYSAWQPRARTRQVRVEGFRTVVLPVAFTFVAAGLETLDHFHRLNTPALVLASAALAIALVRLALTFAENVSMLARTRSESQTDALTGLGNRRHMMEDLEALFAEQPAPRPHLVAVFDLDGFKRYNDTFGHPAGDALLVRLGRRLAAALDEHGVAYRMGGDEFCVIVGGDPRVARAVLAAAGEALTERGKGFDVTSSYGAAEVPEEADAVSRALHLADQRLYSSKAGRRDSPQSQTRDVLMRVLGTRQPGLDRHVRDVASLAGALARSLGLSAEALDEVTRAAELHDIGKMAIPDAILDKRGPLDAEEWAFMHRHTLIGAEILAAAPALEPVARIVRSSHERWDGAGYPDGLAGENIPLGSRVVFACDAFVAMTSDRPYHSAIKPPEALAELRRCSATQFDPEVVDALCAVVAEQVARDSRLHLAAA